MASIERTMFDAFNDEYEAILQQAKCTYIEAYTRAEAKFIKEHDFKPYSSYDSFRKVRATRLRR